MSTFSSIIFLKFQSFFVLSINTLQIFTWFIILSIVLESFALGSGIFNKRKRTQYYSKTGLLLFINFSENCGGSQVKMKLCTYQSLKNQHWKYRFLVTKKAFHPFFLLWNFIHLGIQFCLIWIHIEVSLQQSFISLCFMGYLRHVT